MLNSNKKIVHVLPSLDPGGAERMAVLLAIEQCHRGSDAQVLALGGGSGQALEKLLYEEAVPFKILNKRPGLSLRILREVWNYLRVDDPDIIHTHQHVLPYVMPYALWKSRKVRVVHTVHSLAEHELPVSHRWLYRFGYRWGVTPVAIAKEVARSVQLVYGGNVPAVIPNGIPIPSYANSTKAFPETARHFVMVARMSEPKDYVTLLRAFSRLWIDRPDLDLSLIGDGVDRTFLENYVSELKLGNSIHFMGFRPDVYELLQQMDVFVLMSRWEGNPLSIMEAMAAGIPVIASSVGGVPELVCDGVDGFLVPMGDVESLQRRLEQLATIPHLYLEMGRKARTKAVEFFSSQTMVDRYYEFYTKISAGVR